MSDRKLTPTRQTTRVIAASGRLRNEHFLLTADHLLLEVDRSSFELVSAMAEGNVHVRLVAPDPEAEYVILARGALYQPYAARLSLNGCLGTRENGSTVPSRAGQHHMVVPTDGTFFLPIDHSPPVQVV